MVRKAISVACGSVICCGVLAGCGAGERETEAAATVEDFLTALDRGDTAAACASLAPETAEALAAAEGRACDAAIGSQELPGGSVDEVAVWGDRAQVRTDADVLFLAELDDGWKIVAAGCRPDGERPYQCAVGGS